MRVSLLTNGTTGDVLPFISLSVELKKLGYEVTLGAPDGYQDICHQLGIRYVSLCEDMQAMMGNDELERIIAGKPLAIYRYWRGNIKPLYRKLLQNAWSACENAEVIVYHPKVFCAPDIAEKTGARLVLLSLLPLFTTKQFPIPVLNGNFGGFFNRLSYQLLSFSRLPFISLINQWRTSELQLPKGKIYQPVDKPLGVKIPCLCAVSEQLIKRPSDWSSNIHITESIAPPDSPIPEAVRQFLDLGKAPVYLGFGSMSHDQHSRLLAMVELAVEKYDVRFIVASGWSKKLQQSKHSKQILFIDKVSHGSLFPLVHSVIHHGGAGTTMAALAAGKPMLICPHGMDQKFWGEQVYKQGLGIKPIDIKALDSDKFLVAINDLIQLEHKWDRKKAKPEPRTSSGATQVASQIDNLMSGDLKV